MPTEKPRVTFTVSEETLSEIDKYRYENKFKNQTQAILSLISKGLSDIESDISDGTKKASPLSDEAMKLAENYDDLDDWGKQVVREVADIELARKEMCGPARPMVQAAARGGGVHQIEYIPPEDLPVETKPIP